LYVFFVVGLKKLPDQLFSRGNFRPLETLEYYVFVVRLPLAVWSHKRVSFQIYQI